MKTVHSIEWLKGERVGESIALTDISYIIGRSRRCDICLNNSEDVSGKHVSLEMSGQGVRLINLSSRQQTTFCSGRAIEPNEVKVLKNGDTVQLGAVNVFRLHSSVPCEAGLVNQDKTQIPLAVVDTPTVVSDSSTSDVPTLIARESCNVSSPVNPSSQIEQPSVQDVSPLKESKKNVLAQTQIIQTLLASAEEMVELIRKKAAERRQRLILKMTGAALVFVVFSIIYVFFVKTSPEKVLTWPRDEKGRPDSKRIVLDSPLGPQMIGLEYPNDPAARVTIETSGVFCVTAVSRLGKNHDVPFTTILTIVRDPRSLWQDRDVTFSRWRTEREEKDGWNFQSLSPREFIGFEHGIAYINAQYLRTVKTKEESMQYFGYLLFARFFDFIVTVSREIPAEERWRGASVLSANVGLLTSSKLWRTQWEGTSFVRRADPDQLLVEAEGVLASKSTQRWGEVEFLLRSALIQSYNRDTDAYGKIHARWANLLDLQEREFSRMHSQFMKTYVLRDKKAGEELIADALKVFSSPDDRRNALLEKGRWK